MDAGAVGCAACNILVIVNSPRESALDTHTRARSGSARGLLDERAGRVRDERDTVFVVGRSRRTNSVAQGGNRIRPRLLQSGGARFVTAIFDRADSSAERGKIGGGVGGSGQIDGQSVEADG